MTRNARQLKPLPGYPWKGTFTTGEELSAYFDADKITCLLCGRQYTQLANHVIGGHGIPADDYKAQFGIPWSYSLIGKSLKDRFSQHIRTRIKTGKWLPASRESIEKMHAASRHRRPIVAAVAETHRRRCLAMRGRSERFGPKEFEEYLRRIASGRTPSEVSEDKDMPCQTLFDRQIKENPDFRRRYTEIWESLSYSVHVRAYKLGEKFKKDLVVLRRQGLTWPEVAGRLGVKTTTVRNAWHILKKQGKLEAADLDRAA